MAGAEKGSTLMSRRTTLKNKLTTTVVADDPVAAIPVQGGEIDAELLDDPTPHERAGDDPREEPGEADEELEPAAVEDSELSLVGSLYLHLLSEHHSYESLALEDDDAIGAHAQMHLEQEHAHGVRDWRFHPGRALEVARRRPLDPPA